MDYLNFFSQRLNELRTQKGVSARDMSLSLGQCESYINKIENQKSLPSMNVFFYICDFLDIHPNPDKPEKLFLFSTPCVILKKKGVFICYSLINTLIKFMASLPVMTA